VQELRSKEWLLMPYQEYNGAFNMALDYYFAENYSTELKRPLLRFYGWDPYCLSLGIHQKLRDVDLEKCEQLNIGVVRRPTGGRGVLHSEELTYAVIVPVGEFHLPGIYEYMHQVFAAALKKIGLPAELEENKPDLKAFYQKKHSNLCFASAAKTEVKVHNKKLIGSAQHLFRESILQHGSILVGDYHTKIVELMKLGEKERDRFLKIIRSSTVEIQQLNRQITPGKLAKKILDIMETNGINFSMLRLTNEQLQKIEQLTQKFKVTYEEQTV